MTPEFLECYWYPWPTSSHPNRWVRKWGLAVEARRAPASRENVLTIARQGIREYGGTKDLGQHRLFAFSDPLCRRQRMDGRAANPGPADIVINGRGRRVKWDRRTRASMSFRRLLSAGFVVEILFAPFMLLGACLLAVWDFLRGRR